MIFDKDIWEKTLKGYLLTRCAIKNKNRQMFLLSEDTGAEGIDYYPRKRFLFTYKEKELPSQKYYYYGSSDFGISTFAHNPADNETLAVDMAGNIYSQSNGKEHSENKHPTSLNDTDLTAVVVNLKIIGKSIYSVGIPRKLYLRKGINQWEDLAKALDTPVEFKQGKSSLEYGWNDVAGFSEEDIYLVGGQGDVWYYDGKRFTQLDFPSNELLENVCCADDGYVYIGGNLGRLWRGKGTAWKLLSSQEFVTPWKDIVWFANRLWLGSDYGLWEYSDNELKRATVPSQVKNRSGSLSINAEKNLLLTAGQNGASMFDGVKWEVLIDALEINDAYAK
ncbi:hypothetical protein ACWGOQ_0018790 [Aquimarina sp. M1]